MVKAVQAERVPSLDALRGLAALAVVLFHFTRGFDTTGLAGWFRGLVSPGYLGIEVFFVVSGFAVPLSLLRRGHRLADTGSFLWRRYVRVGLPYLAAAGLAWLLWSTSAAFYRSFQGSPAPELSPLWLGCHASLTCDFVAVPWINVVFWTLAIEFQYYLAIALLLPLLLASPRAAGVITALVLLSSLAAPITLALAYAGPFTQGGLVLARKRQALAPPAFWAGLAAAAIATAIRLGPGEALAGTLTSIIVLDARFEGRVLGWLGGLSYSLYLLHVPMGGRVMNLFGRYGNSGPWLALAIFCALVTSLGAAWVFARLVERPCLRLSHRTLDPRHSLAEVRIR